MISENQTEATQHTPDRVVEPLRAAPFQFQPDPEITSRNSCSIDDLLRYHDRSFVQHAYAVVTRRNATPVELSRTLADLREGKKSKVEIIEALVASEKASGSSIVVHGLPSPVFRKISRWPVIGYVFRVVRALTRLPLLVQDQQRFESYSLAQQQRLADFVNEKLVPAVSSHVSDSNLDDLRTIVADAVESVMMLSDSVVELEGKHSQLAETFAQYQQTARQLDTKLIALENAQRELQSNFEKNSREFHAAVEEVAKHPRELQAHIIELQKQREQTDESLHQDVLRVTGAIQVLQKQFEEMNVRSSENASAQREFLVQEQQVIVEAQKLALKELESQIADLQRMISEKVGALNSTETGVDSEKL